MSTTTEDIKARLNIVEVIGQYVKLQKAGSAWKANCPFHQEKTPSFNVNEERNMWHCFGCGKGGDVFAFVMEIEGLEFREALKLLAEKAGVELPEYRSDGRATAETKDRGLEILELATKFYEKQLWESVPGKKILHYLHDRGLTDESIRTYRLGYAPDGWEHITKFLLSRGFRSEELEGCGLSLRGKEGRGFYDRFRDRIMFPIGDILGRTIGYSARVAPGGDETQAKYVNTPETSLYHKSRALYGLAIAKQSIKETGRTILVEGNVDVIALHQAGLANVVAVSGTALTADQLGILKRYGKKLSLFFDMDKAGQAAAWKSATLALGMDFSIDAVGLTSGKDAADMNREDPELLRSAVAEAKPAMQYFLDALLTHSDAESQEGKREIVERYAELLVAVSSELDRAHWTKALAEAIHADPRVVQTTVEKTFRSMDRGTGFIENRPAGTFLPKSFGRRSEVLRDGIIGLMLVGSEARGAAFADPSEAVQNCLSLHPLHFFIRNNPTDPIAAIEDRALQSQASEMVFRTLELPRFKAENADREAIALDIITDYLKQLQNELHSKDERLDLGRAIEAARAAGDKAEEKRLLESFARLTRDDASQNG
ncbi:MAG: DNA primase [Undibacterium sp.]